ncbi:MAG: hypothetical protein HC871_01835 [Rhizobiales bacterium]|nr:hypothetical protein [Hyphomicrobiales bacterium]
MELTRQAPAGSLQLVQSYGEGGFRVSGVRHQGSVLILPDATSSWPVGRFGDLFDREPSADHDAVPKVEIAIIGCGASPALLPITLREVLQAQGIGIEAMDTGAACRTYNVLAGEGRRVAAALIAL